jgi:uncharacterized coiled-coil DUF342 family protein
MELIEISPESLAKQLIDKHERALKVTTEEFENYFALEKEFDKEAENHKQERDKFNDQVQKLKEQRQNYYGESKGLRKEFMTKLQKKKSMSSIPMEVMILTKQIDQLEWEIQTEAVNIGDEKKLVKQIQDNLDKLHNYANMYQEHEEVSNAVKKLTSELRRKLRKAESMHQQMIAAVNKSDDHHKKFVDSVMKLRDARAKRVGFQHEVEKHQKAIEHWRKLAGIQSKTDIKPKPEEDKNITDQPSKQTKQSDSKPGRAPASGRAV